MNFVSLSTFEKTDQFDVTHIIDKNKTVIWTNYGYATVEDEKILQQLKKKKYIKVKKVKKPPVMSSAEASKDDRVNTSELHRISSLIIT